jgi:hypothetical protein
MEKCRREGGGDGGEKKWEGEGALLWKETKDEWGVE